MELNPKFWENDKLKLEIRSRLMLIAKKFYEFLKIKSPIKDIILTGSSANYNWTSKSDIDLHVVLDFTDIDENTELVKEDMLAHKNLWNDTYDIKIKGFPVELYAQNESEKHYSTGVYSILNDSWIKEPSKEEHNVDRKAIEDKSKSIESTIDKAIKDSDLEKLNKITDKIKEMRSSGLEENGEYSLENLVFKNLRNNGYLEKMQKAKIKITNEQLSLEKQMNCKYRIIDAVLKESPIKVDEQLFLEKKYPNIYQSLKTTLTYKELINFLLLNLKLLEQIKEYPKDMKDDLTEYLKMVMKLKNESSSDRVKGIAKRILHVRPVLPEL